MLESQTQPTTVHNKRQSSAYIINKNKSGDEPLRFNSMELLKMKKQL